MGRKCIVKCLLNGLEADALLVSKQCLPGCEIRDIAELLGMDGLQLKAENGTDQPYEGWVELTFHVIEDDPDNKVTVSFLIAKDLLDLVLLKR